MQELDALVNIDLVNRSDKSENKSLELVRIGTCGILQPDIPVHSWILSTHALGLDNVAHFYPIEFNQEEQNLLAFINEQVQFPKNIIPYLSAANQELVARFNSEKVNTGITVTSSGFYGPQGRSLRMESKMRDIHLQLGAFQNKEQKIMNFEMESSAIFALGKALGHKCTTLCLGVANRPLEEFSTGIDKAMDELIKYVLDRI
jgi:uridine phosphorylase